MQCSTYSCALGSFSKGKLLQEEGPVKRWLLQCFLLRPVDHTDFEQTTSWSRMHEAWLTGWVSNRMAIVPDASLQTLPCALAPSVLPEGFPETTITNNQLIPHHLETLQHELRKLTFEFLKRRLLQVRICLDICSHRKNTKIGMVWA